MWTIYEWDTQWIKGMQLLESDLSKENMDDRVLPSIYEWRKLEHCLFNQGNYNFIVVKLS
jgi:hypothetical protein